MANEALSPIFNQPKAAFVFLPTGKKYPPIQKGWQLPENARSFQEAEEHIRRGGGVGLLAGDGRVGLDEDNPEAFAGLKTPASTKWETRPNRFGLSFMADDVAETLAKMGKKPDLAQLYLYKDGEHVGEIKLQNAYQVIPPTWKILEDGTRADYKLIDEAQPAKISLEWLISDLQRLGIALHEKENDLEKNAAKLEAIIRDNRQRQHETDEQKSRRYGKAALRDEVSILASTSEGDRNNQLNKSAFALGQLVASGILDEAEVMKELSEAANYTGLGPDEIERTVRSGLESGALYPREAPKPENRNIAEGISEDDLLKIKIPENPRFQTNLELDNFIQLNIKYGETVTDSYPDYWFAGGLFGLSVAVNRNAVIKLRQGAIYTNVWINELGLSSLSRKSTSIDKTDLTIAAANIDPESKMPDDFSPEAMIERLDHYPRAYMIKDESAGLLAVMKKDYMRGLKDTLMQLYDGKDINRELRTSKRKSDKTSFRVHEPYLCMLLATTPGSFAANTELLDIMSGWLPRFLHFFPNHRKDRWLPLEEGVPENEAGSAACIARLIKVRQIFYSRSDPLVMHLSEDADAYFKAWQQVREAELVEAKDDRRAQFYSRLAVYVLKIGMLFTIGRADYKEGMDISLSHIKEACRLVDEYFMPVAMNVADLAGKAADKNLMDKIISILTLRGGKITRRQLMKSAHVKRKDLDEALDSLIESGEIRIATVSNPKGPATVWVMLSDDKDNKRTVHTVDNVYSSILSRQCKKPDENGENIQGDGMDKETVGTERDGIRREADPTDALPIADLLKLAEQRAEAIIAHIKEQADRYTRKPEESEGDDELNRADAELQKREQDASESDEKPASESDEKPKAIDVAPTDLPVSDDLAIKVKQAVAQFEATGKPIAPSVIAEYLANSGRLADIVSLVRSFGYVQTKEIDPISHMAIRKHSSSPRLTNVEQMPPDEGDEIKEAHKVISGIPAMDPNYERFKSGVKRRHCLMCNRDFSFDLGIHYKDGYICADCTIYGPQVESKPDPQTTFGEGASI